MSDAEALMAAIAADPRNDLPRLVYADFIEENGDPDRAEFIRVQCELARTADANGEVPPEEHAALTTRERELRALHDEEWLRPFRELGANPRVHGEFHRGFVNDFSMDAAAFAARGAELWRYSPVESVELSGLSGRGQALAATSHLGKPRRLGLHGRNGLASAELRTILESEHLKPLHQLSLSQLWWEEEDAHPLTFAASELQSLSLSGVELPGNNLANFFAKLPPLKGLSLSSCGGVTQFRLGFALIRLNPSRLQRLCVDDMPFDLQAMRALTSPDRFQHLTELWLRWTELGPDALDLFRHATHLTNVARLDLDHNPLGDEGLELLAQWPGLRAVRHLQLRSCQIGSRGISALTASPHLRSLEVLNLDSNDIGDDGLTAITRCPAFASLRELAIRENGITSTGVEALAGATGWAGLHRLDLNGNFIGDEAAVRLAESPVAQSLRWLSIAKCVGSEPTAEAILQALPELRIFHTGRAFLMGDELQKLRQETAARATG